MSSSNKKINVEEFSDIIEKEFINSGICSDNAKIIRNWLIGEYVDIDYGRSKKSTDIGLKKTATVGEIFPLHISSIKLQNSKKSDLGQGLFLYTVLLEHEQLKKEFRNFFTMTVKDDIGNDNIDLDTQIMIKSLANVRTLRPQLNKKLNVIKPYCIGHAKVFADDLWRILAYKNSMPKKEIINAILTLCGLHIGLYYFKLFYAIPDMTRTGKICNQNCSVDPQSTNPFENCPYHRKIFVDCAEDYRSISAELGRSSVKKINREIEPYVKSHLILKKLTEFIEFGMGFNYFDEFEKPDINDLEGLLKLRYHKEIENWATFKIMSSIQDDEDLKVQHEKMKSSYSSSFDTYINLIFDKVYRPKGKDIIGMMDQLLGKNKDTGILRVGKGQKNTRRYCMSAGLIEILIQLAVLGTDNGKNFYTKNITFIELLEWLENRYGILIDKTVDIERTTETESVFRENLINFKAKLRELGFFTDLSDASNMQLVKPRFKID